MKKSFFKKSNSGRSIFELLAVMAIIGLLSITVVKSYEKAVSKARSDAQQRQIAMIVKEIQQKIMGSSVPNMEKIKMNDTEFTVGQGKTGPTKDYFGIKLKTSNETICEELTNTSFLSPALVTVNGEKEGTCPGEVTFYFPKDPSNTAFLETGDESIFSEGSSSGSGGNAQNPSDYDNDENGCLGNNFVYCSNGSCVSDANDCPAPVCPSVLDCGEHGTWNNTTCVCDCETGWYGKICDSDCNGMKIMSGRMCVPCGNDSLGSALQIDPNITPESECHRCNNRFIGKFSSSDANYYCRICTDSTNFVVNSQEECERCGNRKVFIKDGTIYCGLKDCGTDYTQTSDGSCWACDRDTSFESTEQECSKCTERKIFAYDGKTYCGLKDCSSNYESGIKGFHDVYGNCYMCGSGDAPLSTPELCAECDGSENERTYGDGYCYP